LLIFAFVGIEVALIPSGEVKNPARTVPRSAYLALVITTIIYLMIQIVAQGTLGADLANHELPLAASAMTFLGNFGRTTLLVGATISAFGFVTSDILSSPRMIFAFGRDGALPQFFAHVHPRYRSPDVAIITYATLAFALSISGTFEQLAVLSNVAVLLMYLLCCAACWVLVKRDVRLDPDDSGFNFPGMKIVPGLAILAIVWILVHATAREFVVTGIVLAAASVLYLIRRKHVTGRKSRSGMRVLGSILGFYAAYIPYSLVMSHAQLNDGETWVKMVLAAILGVSARLCFGKAQINEQDQRDREAAVIIRDLKQRTHRDYYLYLRPFNLDQATPQKNPVYSPYPILSGHYTQDQSELFEAQFSNAMRGNIPILSLGRQGEIFGGASRVETSDEEWQSLFILLAARARGIFLFPGSSTGSLTELRWIRDNNLLSKTVCLQPPTGTNKAVIEAEWLQIRSNLLNEQFALPEFADKGCIFSLAPSGSLREAWPLPLHDSKKLSNTLDKALPENPTIFWPQESAQADASVAGTNIT
jgi:hypothetical protein